MIMKALKRLVAGDPAMFRKAFAGAAAKPEGISGNDFLDAILRERDDLREKFERGELMTCSSRYGCNANIVIIGDEVFKGPKMEWNAPELDREVEILKQLAGKGLCVPEVKWQSKDSHIFSMKRMPGVEMMSVLDLTPGEKSNIAKDIADFISGMALALPSENGRYAMHGDLNPGNILLDPQTRRVTAIIDFGIIDYCQKGCLLFLPFELAIGEMVRQEDPLGRLKIPDIKPDVQASAKKAGAMLREAFLKASEKAKGMSINVFIDAIKAERDDLAEKTAYKPTQGGCAFVVFFDDEVFKTARPDIKDWAVASIMENLSGSSSVSAGSWDICRTKACPCRN